MLFVNKRGTSPSIINIAMASMLYHRIWGSTSCTNKKNTTLSFVKGASLFIPLIKVSSGISVLVYSYFPYACGHFFFSIILLQDAEIVLALGSKCLG